MSESYKPRTPKPKRKPLPFWVMAVGIIVGGIALMVLEVAGVYAPDFVPYPTGFVHTEGGLNLPVTTNEL